MIRFVLALVAVLACCVPVEATGRVRVRSTPFRPNVGPVVVSRGFVNPVVVNRGFSSRGFYQQPQVIVDQFGRTFIVP